MSNICPANPGLAAMYVDADGIRETMAVQAFIDGEAAVLDFKSGRLVKVSNYEGLTFVGVMPEGGADDWQEQVGAYRVGAS